MLVSPQILRFCPINADVPAILSHCRPLTRAPALSDHQRTDRQGTMSSDTSATGNSPALEPHGDPAVPTAGQASGLAALAPDPAHDLLPGGPARGAPADRGRRLTLAAAAGIGMAILIMIAVSLMRGAWMRPPVAIPAPGPPWEIPVRHVSAEIVTWALWLATLLGAGGVAAGLLAVHRGARVSARVLLVGGLLAVAVLTVLPPAGSTDALDYAAYGRLLALGHSPYVTTPFHLRQMHDAFSRSVPVMWDRYVSVYGPLATMEQSVAARLGGDSRRPDHLLAQAVGLGRVRPRRPGAGPASAQQPGAATARPPALDGQPVAAVGPGRGRAPGRAAGHGGPARAADARRAARCRPAQPAARGCRGRPARDRRRHKDQLRAVRAGRGLGPAPVPDSPGRGGRGRPGGTRAQLRLLRDAGGPGPAQPAQPGQCRQLLPCGAPPELASRTSG